MITIIITEFDVGLGLGLDRRSIIFDMAEAKNKVPFRAEASNWARSTAFPKRDPRHHCRTPFIPLACSGD